MKSLVMCKLNVYHLIIKKYTCFIMFMGFRHTFISVHMCVPGAQGSQKRALDVELRLHTAISAVCVGGGS